MITYIAGKITGDKDYKEKFDIAENKYKKLGYGTIMNPTIFPESTELNWEAYMRITEAMLNECDTIVLLKDWKNSKGSVLEYAYAIKKGLNIIKD